MGLSYSRWLPASLRSLFLHPLRSLLTILGVFIGVASVIWLLAIGEGIGRAVQRQIEELGADNIIVRTIKPPSASNKSGAESFVADYGIRRLDLERLRSTLPGLKRAMPVREIRREFRFGDRLVDGRLVGCTPEYAEITRLKIDRGRFITAADENAHQNVCVLAGETAENLFPFEDPLGRSIRVEQDYYVVIGVMQPKNPSAGIGGSMEAQDYSRDVYVPLQTLWSRLGDTIITFRAGSMDRETVELNQITLQMAHVPDVVESAEIVKQTLEMNHPNADFGVTVPLELIERANSMRIMFMMFLGIIAIISLVVGGIGIMNIMLATVTERTREIGVRRALGARRSDIVRQFLQETVLLSSIGGVTGILGGLLCGPTINLSRTFFEQSFPRMANQMPDVIRTMQPQIVDWSTPLAFGISVMVGVIFGIYPAIRAAKLDPIDALRHE